MVELRRPVKSDGLLAPQETPAIPAKPVEKKDEKMEPDGVKPVRKSPLIVPRHKPKPAPKPPLSTEEWINRANADGPSTSTVIKPMAVSLDSGSIQLLEDLAIGWSMNKLAVITRMMQEAPNEAEALRAFRQTFTDPPGPYLNRSFRIPEAVIVSSNQLPKQLRIYGRSKIIRLLIAFFSSQHTDISS